MADPLVDEFHSRDLGTAPFVSNGLFFTDSTMIFSDSVISAREAAGKKI